MRFNKLDLNLLVALDALLTEQSISRAAEKIHLSQSAMSNALARLREYFDDELLIQVGRRMEPTPRAEVLRDAVNDVLRRIEGSIAAQPAFVAAESTREFVVKLELKVIKQNRNLGFPFERPGYFCPVGCLQDQPLTVLIVSNDH